MKVFVTGATGLLGHHVVHQLREAGHEVIGLVRSDTKARRMIGATGARWVVGDVRDVAAFAHELDGCDAVVHTAAYFREYYQPGDHATLLEDVNVKATLALMREADARGVARFVHTSSSGTIGQKPDGSPGDEDTPPPAIAHENLYFRSKVEGDAKIRAFTPVSGMRVIEILPGWMWGPGDAGPTNAGRLALDFLARRLPGVPPGGTSVVDARDVASATVAAAQRGAHGARYIVGGRPLTLAQIVVSLERASGVAAPRVRIPFWFLMIYATLAELWSRVSGRSVTITRVGVKTMRDGHLVSSARAERDLGVRFRSFDETARDVVAWYREHPIAA
ncbi:NAD-dependent epimerase/dehydratase family protein [Sandaracinus amylolyticus]|uniref:Dihydroflavonol-4-reductase n=1 Tax=Sandaracinus amylolyticus TaxID=927083 RepID=A0A0F6YGK5_9BACT|nr:NAD-dependent epimerase/dehydratase family protein [Sandaracinus amylolyticus]AKF03791.1 Dihydroflavonol-4-reductase [Sandaracinus amylolyticus]